MHHPRIIVFVLFVLILDLFEAILIVKLLCPGGQFAVNTALGAWYAFASFIENDKKMGGKCR